MNKTFGFGPSFQFEELRERVTHLQKRALSAGMDSAADVRSVMGLIDQLETDIGRVLLKVQTVVEVLQQKGIVTADDLAAKGAALDALDGTIDGGLHPKFFRTDAELNQTLSPRVFLARLENEPIVSPTDFLKALGEKERGETA